MISFLKKKSFLNATNDHWNTMLYEAVKEENHEFAKDLIDAGADVDHLCENGGTALSIAVFLSLYDMVELLLSRGAAQCPDDDGDTPLHVVRCEKIAELLVENGGDIHKRNFEGETPLHAATHIGRLDCMKYFIEKGAEVDATSVYGTPLEMAIVNGSIDAIDILLEAGAKLIDIQVELPGLLRLLQEKIDEPDSARMKKPGLLQQVEQHVRRVAFLRETAASGNHHYFTQLFRSGEPFPLVYVARCFTPRSKGELLEWIVGMTQAMRNLYLFVRAEHFLMEPSPIAECLKSFILLPQETRALLRLAFVLHHVI